jgi:hypothetical protein
MAQKAEETHPQVKKKVPIGILPGFTPWVMVLLAGQICGWMAM